MIIVPAEAATPSFFVEEMLSRWESWLFKNVSLF